MTSSAGKVRPRKLDDRRWLRQVYVVDGRSARSIADELGCTDRVVLAALHRLDIPTRPKRPVAPAGLADRDLLYDLYWSEGQSIAAIGDQLGCSAGAVRRAMHRHEIEVRPLGPPRIEQLYDPDWLRETRGGLTAAEMAELLECSESTVRWALWRSGIPAGEGLPRRPGQLDDVNYLLREYVEGQRSAAAIAEEIGCSTATVLRALRRQGLAVRSATRQVTVGECRVKSPQMTSSA